MEAAETEERHVYRVEEGERRVGAVRARLLRALVALACEPARSPGAGDAEGDAEGDGTARQDDAAESPDAAIAAAAETAKLSVRASALLDAAHDFRAFASDARAHARVALERLRAAHNERLDEIVESARRLARDRPPAGPDNDSSVVRRLLALRRALRHTAREHRAALARAEAELGCDGGGTRAEYDRRLAHCRVLTEALAAAACRLPAGDDAAAVAQAVDRLPWEFRYCVEMDPLAPVDGEGASVQLGGRITDARGRDVFDDRCCSCGCEIDSAPPGVSAETRHRCVDCDDAVFCAQCFEVECLLVSVAPSLPDPHAGHTLVPERNHPIFLRMPLLAGGACLSCFLMHALGVQYAARPLFGARARAAPRALYRWMSYAEVLRAARAFAATHNLRGGADAGSTTRFVAICLPNSPLWYIIDIACALHGLAVVGVPTTASPADAAHMLGKCSEGGGGEVVAIFCDSETAHTFAPNGASSPPAERVVLLDEERVLRETTVLSSSPKNDDGLADHRTHAPPDAVYTLLFTSGSTGPPKGVITTRDAWLRDLRLPANASSPSTSCSWLPASWGADRLSTYQQILNGGRIGFSSAATLLTDLRVLHPTFFFAPPAFFNSLFAEWRRSPRAVAGALGLRIAEIGTGGAPVAPAVLEFVRRTFRVSVAVAYGTSECGGITSNGRIIPGVEVRLRDLAALGYRTTGSPFPRGEICVRSALVAAGYWREDAATAKQFSPDGWYFTGDVGELRPDGRLIVVDRVSSVFKLPRGEFVAPARVEAVLEQSRFVDRVLLVHGGPHTDFLVALATVAGTSGVDSDAAPADAGCVAFSSDDADAAALVLDDFCRLAHAARLRACERPRAVALLPCDAWSVENGCITPSDKLRRKHIAARFESALAEVRRRAGAAAAAVPGDDGRDDAPGDGGGESAPAPRASSPTDVLREILESAGLPDADLKQPLAALVTESLLLMQILLRIRERFEGSEGAVSPLLADSGFVLHAPLAEVAQALHREQQEDRTEHLQQQQGRQRSPLAGALAASSSALRLSSSSSLAASGFSSGGPTPADDCELLDLAAPADTVRLAGHDVLLTGASGFLGLRLVEALLRRFPASSRIVCLVRSDVRSFEARVAAHVAAATGAAAAAAAAARVCAVRVDPRFLETPRLGLPDDEWRALAASVSCVVHAAAHVHFTKAYSQLRGPNVLGVLEVVRLCAASRPAKRLVHVSTLGVFGAELADGVVVEEGPPPGGAAGTQAPAPPRGLDDGYTASKWAAEHLLVRCARACAVPVRVVRPGFVSFDTRTGASNPDDWLTRFVRAVMASRAYPAVAPADFSLGLAPVEWVADATAALAAPSWEPRPQHEPEFFHLRADDNFFLDDALLWMQLDGCVPGPLARLPYRAWVSRIRDDPRSPLFPLLSLFEAGFPSAARGSGSFVGAARAQAHLPPELRRAPEVGEEAFLAHVRWLRAEGLC